MNIEKQIQNLISEEHAVIDPDSFLDRLHSTRQKRNRNRQRLSYGISMSVIVLLVGVLAFTLDALVPPKRPMAVATPSVYKLLFSSLFINSG